MGGGSLFSHFFGPTVALALLRKSPSTLLRFRTLARSDPMSIDEKAGRLCSLSLLLLSGLALVACETKDVRGQEGGTWSPPTDSTETFPVTIARPATSGQVPTQVLELNGEPARVGCATCHGEGSAAAIAKVVPGEARTVHASLLFVHGPLGCDSCHVEGAPEHLHTADREQFPLDQSMRLCSQCHGLIRRAYDHGAHGGMRGYWDLQRGPRTRNDCITCHDPHSPAHTPITPATGPKDRFGRSGPRHPGSAIEERFPEVPHE